MAHQKYTTLRSLNKTVDSLVEPVTFDELKEFLRIDFDDDKKLIDAIAKGARISLENWLNRAFITQEWRLTFDSFPLGSNRNEPWWDGVRQGRISDLVSPNDFIPLQLGRIQSVVTFTSFDDDNVGIVFPASNFFVDTASEPGRVIINQGSTWPTALRDRNAIQIDFKAGYGDNRSDIPEDIKTAIKLFTNEIYNNRCDGSSIPETVKMIAMSYKIMVIG